MAINERALEKEIKKYLKTYAETYCRQASKELTEFAKDAIQKFYDDYTPKYYNRTYDLLNNSFEPYYHNNGRVIYGGVRITSSAMQPYRGAGISQHEIASSAWRIGLHGFNNRDPYDRIYTAPPLYYVREKMNEKTFLDKLNKIGETVAKKQKYTYLKLK